MTESEKINLVRDTFRGREDAYGTGKGRCVKQNVTDDLIRGHLAGRKRIGRYPLSPDILNGSGTCWVVIDIDNDDLNAAIDIANELQQIEVNAYIERSKSKGLHVWTFFTEAVSAAKARALAEYALNGDSFEVFPKQDSLDGIAYGSYLNMPLFGTDVPKGRTVFLDPAGDYQPHDNQWDALKAITKVEPGLIEDLIERGEIAPEAYREERKGPLEYAKAQYVDMWRNGIPQGKRTDALAKLAGHYYSKGIDLEEAIAMAQALDRSNPHGSVDDDPQYAQYQNQGGKVAYTIRDIYKRNAARKQEPARDIAEEPNYRERLRTIRKETKGQAGFRKELTAQTVLEALIRQGELIKTHSDYYYFHRQGRRVMPLESMDFTALINDMFGLVETEADFRYTIGDLRSKCFNEGMKAEVYIYSHFSQDTLRLYVDRFDGMMYRLDGDNCDAIHNGEDGVVFRFKPTYQLYTIREWDEGDYLNNHLIRHINFHPEPGALLVEDYQFLIRTWLYSIFFEELAPTKPIALFTGAKGSGKSVAAKMIGRLLFGEHFNVNPIGEERDFVASLCSNYLIAFDNADTQKKWLPERLATAATGGTIALRELYETNTEVEYYPRCFLILTARTPKFKRDDVVERLLIFPLERLQKFRAESVMMRELLENRDKMLSELFHQLNICIRRIKENPEPVYEGNFRMADFAEFGAKTLDTENRTMFMAILEKMSEKQAEFLLEDDPFVEMLSLWVGNPKNTGRWITANGLHAELMKLAERKKITFPYDNAIAIGAKLRHGENALQSFFEINKESPKGHPTRYSFRRKDTQD